MSLKESPAPALSTEGHSIRQSIKFLMKKQGKTQHELAHHLGLSLATVKRFLSRDDFPLERVVSIAGWLGSELADLCEIGRKREERSIAHLSAEQEAYLSSQPSSFLVFLSYYFQSASDFRLCDLIPNAVELEKIHLDLTAQGLLLKKLNGSYVSKYPRSLRMRHEGLLFKKFLGKIYNRVFEESQNYLSEKESLISKQHIDVFSLTEKSLKTLYSEVRALEKKYYLRSRMDKLIFPDNQLKEVTLMSAIAEENFPLSVLMEELKR